MLAAKGCCESLLLPLRSPQLRSWLRIGLEILQPPSFLGGLICCQIIFTTTHVLLGPPLALLPWIAALIPLWVIVFQRLGGVPLRLVLVSGGFRAWENVGKTDPETDRKPETLPNSSAKSCKDEVVSLKVMVDSHILPLNQPSVFVPTVKEVLNR